MINQRLKAPTVLTLKDVVQLTPAVQQPLASVAVLAIAFARGSLLTELFRDEFFATVNFLRCCGAFGDLRRTESVGNDQKLRQTYPA